MDENSGRSPVTGPQPADHVFTYLSADMQNYLAVAKKYSKQYKHFFLGIEHFFAAFLSENNSAIRRYINMDKTNWKKKINDLLVKSYSPSKTKTVWSGFFVTPRMQKVWNASVELTRFKEVSDVAEVHVLMAMLGDPQNLVCKWINNENLGTNYDGIDIRGFLTNEINTKMGTGGGPYNAIPVIPVDKIEKPKASPDTVEPESHKEDKDSAAKKNAAPNPFNILKGFSITELFKKKESGPSKGADDFSGYSPTEDEAAKEADTQSSVGEIPALFSDDTASDPPVKETSEPFTSSQDRELDDEEEFVRNLRMQEEAEEPVKHASASGTKSLTVGTKVLHINITPGRGISENILDKLEELVEKNGSLPERIPFRGKKIPFEEFLAMELTEAEYELIVKDIDAVSKIDKSKSPFGKSALRNAADAIKKSEQEEESSPKKDEAPPKVIKLEKIELIKPKAEASLVEPEPIKIEEEKTALTLSIDVQAETEIQEQAATVSPVGEKTKETFDDDDEEMSLESVAEDIDTQITSALSADSSAKSSLGQNQTELAGAAAIRKSSYKPIVGALGASALKQITGIEKIDISSLSDFTLLTGINERLDLEALLSTSGACFSIHKIYFQPNTHWPELSRVSVEYTEKVGEVANQVRMDSFPVVIGKN